MEQASKRDLEYIFNKYLAAIRFGKPSPKIAKQLILLIESNELYLMVKDCKDIQEFNKRNSQ